jgi:hypothetical protein
MQHSVAGAARDVHVLQHVPRHGEVPASLGHMVRPVASFTCNLLVASFFTMARDDMYTCAILSILVLLIK